MEMLLSAQPASSDFLPSYTICVWVQSRTVSYCIYKFI